MADLVAQIKAMQRADPEAKQAWWAYCDQHLGGVKDPAKHDAATLQGFLDEAAACFDAQAAPAPRQQRPAPGRQAQQWSDPADVVAQIKALQRSDPEAKQAWWAYCDQHLGGVKDPAKHDAATLQGFLDLAAQGSTPAPPRRQAQRQAQQWSPPPVQYEEVVYQVQQQWAGGMDTGDLAGMVKTGQRHSAHWKVAWQAYCQMYGGGVNDPNKHDMTHITGFLDYVGQLAQADLGAAAAMVQQQQQQPRAAPAGKRTYQQSNGGGSGPPAAKRQNTSSGLDPEKAQLVDRVKSLQRSDPSKKQAWWGYCAEQLGGVNDPAKHEADVLAAFLAQHEN